MTIKISAEGAQCMNTAVEGGGGGGGDLGTQICCKGFRDVWTLVQTTALLDLCLK